MVTALNMSTPTKINTQSGLKDFNGADFNALHSDTTKFKQYINILQCNISREI